ncbi:hypothetical protein IL54_0495 [Sphingobium sp. ba1]|nr:hypothetical protein IL54_0495 [Sphingobium sp. ba1]
MIAGGMMSPRCPLSLGLARLFAIIERQGTGCGSMA